MADEKPVVISVIHRLTDADFPSAELHAANLGQLVAGIDTFVFGLVFLVTIAAGRGNHGDLIGIGVKRHIRCVALVNESCSVNLANCMPKAARLCFDVFSDMKNR